MAEPLLREPVSPLPYEVAGEAQTSFRNAGSTQELLDWLQRRWDELQDRIKTLSTAYGSSFAKELRETTEKARDRVRYYHERRPLQVLGFIAAATFAFGLLVGLRRRG